MTVPDGNHRHPVRGRNCQHIITVEENTVVDAYVRHADGTVEEIPREDLDDPCVQDRLLSELEAQRKGGQ